MPIVKHTREEPFSRVIVEKYLTMLFEHDSTNFEIFNLIPIIYVIFAPNYYRNHHKYNTVFVINNTF